MRIGIELVQIHPQQSGGCVQLLQGVLPQLFRLAAADEFFLYTTAESWLPESTALPNVTTRILPKNFWYYSVGAAAANDGIDVLFRSYPVDVPPVFPLERMVVLVPDLQHEYLPDFFPADLRARRAAAFAPAISQAGAVAVLAEHGRRLLEERYPQRHGDVFLLSPASAMNESLLQMPLDPDEEAQVPREPFFLYPANLWPHKNHRCLFEAFARFLAGRSGRATLVLTGDPTSWPELQACCAHLPVSHLGYVRPRLLAELYQRALALVYFSLFEGFGIPVLEAFHLGTPVLCSNTTSLPDLGGDAVLSCDPTDVAAMAGLLTRIADDACLRAVLVARGSERGSLYCWESSARNLLAACRRVGARPAHHEVVLDTLRALAGPCLGFVRLGEVAAEQVHQIRSLQEQLAASQAEGAERLRLLEEASAERQLLAKECAARLDLIQGQVDVLAARAMTIDRQQEMIERLEAELAAARAPLLTRVNRKLRRLSDKLWTDSVSN